MDTIRCDRLCKSFDGIRAVADLTLELPETGVVAIIGPNGAGKTTLLNLLTGFLRPDSGRCLLGGREITQLAPHRIARLGVGRTFQDLRLIEQVPGLENVMLARPNQRGEGLLAALLRFGVAKEEAANREEAMRLLRFVGLADKAAELAGELSYGEQKLLTIACCLATEARILFFDEPVTGVHPEIAGAGSALYGFLQMGAAATGIYISGLFENGTEMPMIWTVSLAIFAATAAALIAARDRMRATAAA